MTRILAIALALTTAAPVVALTSDQRQACEAIGTLANVIMAQRQAGASLDSLLPFAEMADGPVRALAEDVIRTAFDVPVAPTPEGKAEATQAYQRASVAGCEASYGG